MLMMTLDDATDVAMKYAKTGYPRDFIRSELEQKCYIACGDHAKAIKECADEITIEAVLVHIKQRDLADFLENLRVTILAHLPGVASHDGDQISRSALLAAYDAAHKGPPGGARKLIEEAPGLDVAPVVHGRWEFCGDDDIVCSTCGARYLKKRLLYAYYTGPGSDRMDGFWHCPHCGALLDGGDDRGCKKKEPKSGGEEIQPTVDAAPVVRCEDCTLRGTERCLWYDADDDLDCCSHDDTMNGGDDA